MDDWRALKYNFNVTSTVDLTQLSDVLADRHGVARRWQLRRTITGEGDKYQIDGGVKSDALAADNIRLQGLNVTAKGSGQGESYDFNGRAVAQLLTAGDFQLNAVQITGGVMGTGSDFRWVGELRAAAEKSYGTTITGLILRDAVAEYRDGVLTASAPQLIGSSSQPQPHGPRVSRPTTFASEPKTASRLRRSRRRKPARFSRRTRRSMG